MHAVIYTTAYKPNPLARTMKILLSALLSTQLKRRTEFSSFETKKIYLVKNQEYKPCLKTPFSLPQFFPPLPDSLNRPCQKKSGHFLPTQRKAGCTRGKKCSNFFWQCLLSRPGRGEKRRKKIGRGRRGYQTRP